jgi:hypothetical protein
MLTAPLERFALCRRGHPANAPSGFYFAPGESPESWRVAPSGAGDGPVAKEETLPPVATHAHRVVHDCDACRWLGRRQKGATWSEDQS